MGTDYLTGIGVSSRMMKMFGTRQRWWLYDIVVVPNHINDALLKGSFDVNFTSVKKKVKKKQNKQEQNWKQNPKYTRAIHRTLYSRFANTKNLLLIPNNTNTERQGRHGSAHSLRVTVSFVPREHTLSYLLWCIFLGSPGLKALTIFNLQKPYSLQVNPLLGGHPPLLCQTLADPVMWVVNLSCGRHIRGGERSEAHREGSM